MSARLRNHADRIEAVLPEAVAETEALPSFPKPSGVAAGWKHLDLTWPYAVLLFGLALIVVVLWVILVRRFVALREAQASVQATDGEVPDSTTEIGLRTRRGVMIGPTRPAGSNGVDRETRL